MGDEVDVAVHDGVIVVAPTKHLRSKHRLRELVRQIPKGHKSEEVGWGDPVGKEIW